MTEKASARLRIAENVATFRKSQGWTQTELCQRLAEHGVEMSKAGLSALERSPTSGRPASFPADLVDALAIALNVTPNDLFGTSSDPVSYGAGYLDGQRAAFARLSRLLADAETP